MRFSTAGFFVATAYLAIGATARPHPAPAATYNVVDVGGLTESASAEQPATIYETVKTTLPVQQTITEVSPAATSKWTVVIAGGEATTTFSSGSSATPLSTSTSCTSYSTPSSSTDTSMPYATPSTTAPVYPSIPIETAPASASTRTADDGFYHPTGDLGLYRTSTSSAAAYSTSTAAGYSYQGVAKATGWTAPWNATGNYVRRGFAAPSGKLPSPNVVKHLDMLWAATLRLFSAFELCATQRQGLFSLDLRVTQERRST